MYTCPECGCCCDHDKPCCQQFGGGNTDHLGERGGCKRLDPRAVPAEQRIGPLLFLRRLLLHPQLSPPLTSRLWAIYPSRPQTPTSSLICTMVRLRTSI